MDRKFQAFVDRQVRRLLEAARSSERDPGLHAEILAIAEFWMQLSLDEQHARQRSEALHQTLH